MGIGTLFIIFGFVWFVTLAATRRRRWSRLDDVRGHRLQSREQSETLDRIHGLLTDMSARLDRLEEERDFYRDLLGSDTRFRGVESTKDDATKGEPTE